jgi:hypothetical protein
MNASQKGKKLPILRNTKSEMQSGIQEQISFKADYENKMK